MAVTRDTGGLLKDLAAVSGFDREDLVDLALTDDGVALPAHTGVHEQLVNVLEADRASVDIVFTFARAVIPAGDHNLRLVHVDQTSCVVQHQRDFGVAGLLALGGTAEDDVLHLAAAQRAGGLLTHDPADGVGNIGFARAIWADDGGNILTKSQHRLIGEGLEALDLQCF